MASSKQGAVTLGEVVKITPATGPSSIQRMNRERQVTLSTQIAPGGDQAGLMASIDQIVAGMDLPAGTPQLPLASRWSSHGRRRTS